MTAHAGTASVVVRRLWQFCNVLRDDGLSYPDYVEQLTYLLFLKLADERRRELVPAELAWSSFAHLDGTAMSEQYDRVLESLGTRGGTLGLIFGSATNKIADPAKLRYLVVELIGRTEWTGLSDDVKGDAYEGLLEKNARDTKSGAGQYFTPRPLIDALVECIAPQPGEVILDPACGTGGFLLAAHQYILDRNPHLTRAQRRHLATKAMRGVELVQEVARLATMNLFLHGISGEAEEDLPISCADSLRILGTDSRADVILTNPPFGVKGSVTFTPGGPTEAAAARELSFHRPDFWVSTANKQLSFLQHVVVALTPHGRAAVVIPDNVLFESGAAAMVRRRLLETCDVHTLLRLPPGLFYASGVTANVLFFDRQQVTDGSMWVYDLRSGNRFSLKTRPIQRDDLSEFVELYNPTTRARRETDMKGPRWRSFSHKDLLESDTARLDLSWDVEVAGRAGPAGLARVDQLAQEVADELERALQHIAHASRPFMD
jgi:type I restriction enzyme M protein